MPLINGQYTNISSIPLVEQSSTPATPASGKSTVFVKADGLYVVDDAGTVTGPLSEAGLTNPMTTAGDIIVGGTSGVPARLAMGAASKVLAVNSGGTALEWATGSASALNDYICITDKKTSGTAGGTFTSGAFRTRDLNTEQSDTGGHASVASNQITLAAGTYICCISCPAVDVNNHVAKLYNISDSADILIGSAEFVGNTRLAGSRSFIQGKFALAAQKVLEVQHKCTTTQATYGLGANTSFADEIYTIAEFWKVA